MSDALVRVVVPARNAAETLTRTLDGLAAQELDGKFEVIVVDNAFSVTPAWGLFESANLFIDRSWFERLGGFSDGIAARDNRPLAEDVFLG